MAKFNKDEFKSKIQTSVENAILKGLITREDIENRDQERLDGFIRFQLADSVEDRKWCVDILKDFNYDEKASWEKLESRYGKFKSLTDVALVNLWKFLENEKVTSFDTYATTIDRVMNQPEGDDNLLDNIKVDEPIDDEPKSPVFKSKMRDIDDEDLDEFEPKEDEEFVPRRFNRF